MLFAKLSALKQHKSFLEMLYYEAFIHPPPQLFFVLSSSSIVALFCHNLKIILFLVIGYAWNVAPKAIEGFFEPTSIYSQNEEVVHPRYYTKN